MGKSLLSTVFLMMILLGVVLPAGGAHVESLTQVIDGARKERTVTAKLSVEYTPKSMERLEREIRKKFGVDLDIKFTPTERMAKDLADAIMEHKAGATPSYDLMNLASHVVTGMKAGIFDRVEWKPLITRDTNYEVVLEHPAFRGAIVNYTGYHGLMHNPEKVPSDDVPKTLSALADPKWRGKVGTLNSPDVWARWAFYLGKEKVLSNIRAILKNKSIQGRYVDLYNRYMLGEVSLCFTANTNLKMAQDKGMPAAWQSLDVAEVPEFGLVVRKGARHPNAAKLVAIYLASPEGATFTWEEARLGNLYYPGNIAHNIRLQNQRQGIPEVFPLRKAEIIEFNQSGEYPQWQKEIKIIFDTAQ